MSQKKTWIVKWMPEGTDLDRKGDGHKYFRGDTNRAYEDYAQAEERAMYVANDAQRAVGVFELVAAFAPPQNIVAIPIVGEGKAETRTKKAATRRAPVKKKAGRKR